MSAAIVLSGIVSSGLTVDAESPIPGPPTWGAVLVAGDDSVAVFDNGVDALAEQLADRDVEALTLTATDGSATEGGIALGIATVGASGVDACFVYLTSHGTEEGLLLALESDLLAPAVFVEMLDVGCGRRPTVVIVSACHSGTFLTEEMQTANRVVFTAARTDRSSFGCGADDEFSFYDGCMLEALPEAETWADLNDGVVDCVEAKEAELSATPSLPQFYIGAQMEDVELPVDLLTWLKGG